jgi:hypothetical protein
MSQSAPMTSPNIFHQYHIRSSHPCAAQSSRYLTHRPCPGCQLHQRFKDEVLTTYSSFPPPPPTAAVSLYPLHVGAEPQILGPPVWVPSLEIRSHL